MLVIYVIFFGLWLYLNVRYYGFNISSFLISLYFFSSILSIMLLYGYDEFDINRINIYAIIYHIICYFLFMFPIVWYGNRFKINKDIFPPLQLLKTVLYFIIILSICSIVVSFPKLIYSFSFQDLSEARRLHNQRELFVGAQGGILDYLGSLGKVLSFYSLFFFFYIYVYYRDKKLLLILLLISSFAIVISNMAIMGRDGAIRWVLFFISLYILFKDYLSIKDRTAIKRIAIIPTVIITITFTVISLSRFGGRGNGLLYYLISYGGQQNIYFSYNFEKFINGAGGGKINFSYLFDERISINNLNEIFSADYNLNTFSSFVGSIYMDLGLIKTISLALVVFILNIMFLNKVNFHKNIYFLILYEIIILGYFYYMFYSPTTINTLVLFYVLCYAIYLANYILPKKN